MNRFTPLMLLTLVVFSLATPFQVFAADEDDEDATICPASEVNKLKTDINEARDKAAKSGLSLAEQESLTKKAAQLQTRLTNCETAINNRKSERKEACKLALDKFNEVKKDFKYTDQVAAEKCLGAETKGVDAANLLLGAYLQSYEGQAKPGCENYLKDNESKAKDLKTEVKKIHEDLQKDEKKVVEAEEKMGEELNRLKEEKSKLEEGAEDAASDTLKRIQKRQDDLQQAIIEANSKLVEARQSLDTIPEGMNASLMNFQYEGEFVDLADNQSIDIFCKNKVKKSLKSPKGSSSGVMEKSVSKGKAKVAELNKVFESCRKRLSNSRSNVIAAHERALVKAKRAVEDMELYITKRTEDLKKTTEEYKTETEKINNRLLKASAQINEKFNLAQKAGTDRINAIRKGILSNQMQLAGTLNSKGAMSRKNAREVQGKYDEMVEIYEANKDSCKMQFKGLDPSVNLKKTQDRDEENETQQ